MEHSRVLRLLLRLSPLPSPVTISSSLSISLVSVSGRRLLPHPQPPLRRGCHIAACGAPGAADSAFPRPQLGTRSREAVPAGPRRLWPTRNSTPPPKPRTRCAQLLKGLSQAGGWAEAALAPLSGVLSLNPPPDRAPLCPSPRAPRSLTQRRADHESQQRPHDCAAPLSRAAGINSGARGGGARRPLECPRERAGAAAAALEPARWGKEGGRGPPAPVTAGGPAPGPGVRASPPRGWLLLVRLLR